MRRILFVCCGQLCRSQMAAAFARSRHPDGVEVRCACTDSTRVHPLAAKSMSELGIDISDGDASLLSDVGDDGVDVLVSLSRKSTVTCPILPGRPARVHWDLPEPSALAGDEDTVLAAFRELRDNIRRLVDDFFDRGYLEALSEAKSSADLILDSITDGIIAHDMERRIFHFNRAAEVITGYDRAEVMNRDCHDVFPGNLCGGKCDCEGDDPPEFRVRRLQADVCAKNGEKRLVDMVRHPIFDGRERRVGILTSFHDVTREHRLARRVREIQQFSGIVGRDEKMLEVFDLIRDLADTDVPVLVQGESGTGKELVAAAIHNEGPRASKLFVPVNCGALPESLLESELFGHVKGAFTGAYRDKKGRFELADGGTIFLDEIGDISPAMQVRLLRVLQEGRFERVGSEETRKVDTRVISATNKDLTEEIEAARFREDLYYRLSVVPILLPALRERRNDIPILLDHVLKRTLSTLSRKDVSVSSEALDVMMNHDWPGNVRELQNWVQFALVKCKDNTIRPEHLPPAAHAAAGSATRHRRRRKLDIASVRAALEESGGNKVLAAKLLGVSRATLYRFLADVGMDG